VLRALVAIALSPTSARSLSLNPSRSVCADRNARLLRSDKKRRRALAAAGIEYEFGGYTKAAQSASQAGGAAAIGIKKARHVKLG
jgi:hypothetical protein